MINNFWHAQSENILLRELERSQRGRAAQSHAHTKAVYVYAIEGAGLIKFGVSNCPESRLRTLQTGSPALLRIVALIAGEHNLEASIHRFLSGDHSHGEWFVHSEKAEQVLMHMRNEDLGKLKQLVAKTAKEGSDAR